MLHAVAMSSHDISVPSRKSIKRRRGHAIREASQDAKLDKHSQGESQTERGPDGSKGRFPNALASRSARKKRRSRASQPTPLASGTQNVSENVDCEGDASGWTPTSDLALNQTESGLVELLTGRLDYNQQQEADGNERQDTSDLLELLQAFTASCDMNIIVYYGTTEVARHHVDNPFGCRLFYCPNFDSVATLNLRDPSSFHLAFGDIRRTQINLPAPLSSNPKTQSDLVQLLEGLKRGLLLDMVSNDMFATNMCLSTVYCSDSRSKTSEAGKLRRGQRTKVFDYSKRFSPYFQQHCETGGSTFCPSSELYFTFGRPWHRDRPAEECALSVAVVHCLARSQVQTKSPKIPLGLSGLTLQIENPDEMDEYLAKNLRRPEEHHAADTYVASL